MTVKQMRNLSWQERAACAGAEDPEVFFDPTKYAQALLICASCPVKAQCRELGKGMGPGVWGGRVQNTPPRVGLGGLVLMPHGTEAAYQRHIRLKQDPCLACVEGASAARNRRKRRKAE